jgi:hypothetical protein
MGLKNPNIEVVIHKDQHRDAERWCRENLGKRWSVLDNRDGIWSCFWDGRRKNYAAYRYCFKNAEDATIFALKFSS